MVLFIILNNSYKEGVCAMTNNTKELTPEERELLINNLSCELSGTIISKQRVYTEEAIRDLQRFQSPDGKKAHFASKYGPDSGLTFKNNYCLAIQMYGFQKVNKDIGNELCSSIQEKGLDNPLYLKTKDNSKDMFMKNPVCQTDSLGRQDNFNIYCFVGKYNNYMEGAQPTRSYSGGTLCTASGAAKKQELSQDAKFVKSYVNSDGTVKKDNNGEPLLKDGDLMFVQVGNASNTATGFHCVRVNVDENGKVTYSAGNGDRINGDLLKSFGNKKACVFKSSEYIQDCLKIKMKDLTDEQLLALARSYNITLEGKQIDDANVPPEKGNANTKASLHNQRTLYEKSLETLPEKNEPENDLGKAPTNSQPARSVPMNRGYGR